LPIRHSQTDWSKLFIEIAAIHCGDAFFMSHHVSETLRAIVILKEAQCAGFSRKDCKVHSDAVAASAVFQDYMSVHYAAESRLRRARENRPVSLCGYRKGEKENGVPKSHVSDAVCQIASAVPS
jgi:hypothetical protein